MRRWKIVGSMLGLAAGCSLVNAPEEPAEPGSGGSGTGTGTTGGGGSECEGPLTTLTDCGACGVPCAPDNVTGATCASGSCDYGACVPGFQDCDGNRGSGCESDTDGDPENCGGCGNDCAAAGFAHVTGTACVLGGCEYVACEPGWADCEGPDDGCERAADTLVECGDCGVPCQPENVVGPECPGGVCGYASCVEPFQDCDGDSGNGCESNRLSDLQNCGSCGAPCDTGAFCLSGQCGTVGRSCKEIRDAGGSVGDGIYLIDPGGGDPSDAVEGFCDMTTDGGGWTLVAWTGNSAAAPVGVPYPGLAPCPTLDCLRGTMAPPPLPELLLQQATELGQAQSTATLASYLPMHAYPYAGKHAYPSLQGLTLAYSMVDCTAVGPLAQGTFTTLVGPADFNGATSYLSQHLSYAGYDFASDANVYIWDIGVPVAYCNGNGAMPGSWMGTWASGQYGPFVPAAAGAYSVWAR